jgi:hypothetical protein
MARKKQGGKPTAKVPPRPTGPSLPPPINTGKCPACGADIVWLLSDGVVTPVQAQRRLVLFTFKADGNGLPLEDEKPIVGFDEFNGRLVLGRAAHPVEARRYKEVGNPGKPYAIAHEGHLRHCTRWDRWMSGAAEAPPSATLAGR